MEVKITFSYFERQNDIFFSSEGKKYIIVPKGRRAGITKGAEMAFIEWALDGISPMLWVDTINGNIDRYFERYFLPDLEQIKDCIEYKWNQQKRELKIGNSVIDFRSADAPENIEGFGYKKIFLNEAGIILKNSYLYKHAIMPMLLDYPESQLIAAGVPKGMYNRDGEMHKFYELAQKAQSGHKDYVLMQVTTFDNPIIKDEEIRNMILEMDEYTVRQEIYGEFIERNADNPFMHKFGKEIHISDTAVFKQRIPIILSFDFNLNPFACTLHHIWTDQAGEHHHIFDEFEVRHGSITEMADRIKSVYGQYLYGGKITGDATGRRNMVGMEKNLYLQLITELGMSESQIILTTNPPVMTSRVHCNSVLARHPDFKINPSCKNTIYDMMNVQCDAMGDIVKRDRKVANQRADYLDTVRYVIHNFQNKYNPLK